MIFLAASYLYGHVDGSTTCFSITPHQVVIFIICDAKAIGDSFFL